MGNNIKGITVEIGGDTGPLSTALKDVNKTAGDLQSELRQVNRQLKFDPKDTTLLNQKLDLLKQSTQALEEKQKTLKSAVEQAHSAFEKGDLGADKVRAVEREYEKVNSQLKETKKDLAEAESASGSFTEKVKGKFSLLKDKIKDTFSAENIKSAIGAVGIAVGGFLKSSTDEAKDAQATADNLTQTIKSTGGAAGLTAKQMEELAEKEMSVSTFSKDDIESGEAMLATFTNIGKNVFPLATQSMLDFAQKMGEDPKTAARTLGKALNDPTNGITKLTRAGVTFTDQQKEQIKAMQKSGDTAGAQKVMLAELNKEFGGQALAATKGYDGEQKQLNNDMKEIKETVGSALLPVLTKIGQYLVSLLKPVAQFITAHPKITAAILAIIAVLGTLVGGMSLATTVLGFFSAAATVTGVSVGAAVAPILIIIVAITALAVGAIAVVAHWKQVSGFFTGLWNTIKGLFAGIGAWFSSVFSAAASGVQAAWSGITGFFSTIWNGITAVFSAVGAWFVSVFGAAVSGIRAAWAGITGFFSGIWSGITGIFSIVGGWFSNVFGTAVSGIQGAWSGITGFFSGVWNGITGVFNVVGGWFGNIFEQAKQAIAEHFSPSALSDHFGSVWSSIQGTFSQLNPAQWGKDLIDGIANGIRSAADHVREAVGNVAQDIKSFLHFSEPDTGPLVGFHGWWKDMMYGIAEDINSNVAPVIASVRGVASSIAKNINIPSLIQSTRIPAFAVSGTPGYAVSHGSSPSNPITVKSGDTIVNKFEGSYSFRGKDDIDYFMNQAALLVNRKK